MINKISVNEHSSICIKDKLTLYFDPFRIKNESHDADIIFITHSHFDHYSLEDIKKIINENTVLVFPKSMENEVIYLLSLFRQLAQSNHNFLLLNLFQSADTPHHNVWNPLNNLSFRLFLNQS